MVRIVCTELESWLLGDLAAISYAYGKNFVRLRNKRKFRTPDNLANAKQELRKIVPIYQPIDGARRIASYMDVNCNCSPSFNMFVSGVRRMTLLSK